MLEYDGDELVRDDVTAGQVRRDAELEDAVVVEFPLRGEWSVERTPARRIPSHGTDLLGQRFAYDLVRTDHRPGFHLHPAGTLRLLLIGGGRVIVTAGGNRSMRRRTA